MKRPVKECCIQSISDFVKNVSDKFDPEINTNAPEPATGEQFGIIKVVLYMATVLEDMEKDARGG